MELERMETADLAAELKELELKRQRGELEKEESRRHQALLNQVINLSGSQYQEPPGPGG